MVSMSVRWSEGKTMTAEEGGSEFRQVWVCVCFRQQRGCTKVQARKEQGKSKMGVV